MKLTFNPTVHNLSIDGEKLCLQFLMVAFAISITYFICRPMRICAKQYEKMKRKTFKLEARIDVVLNQQSPICASVLHHNMVRYRRSLVASYLKDFINENQYEPDKFATFFSNSPQTLLNKVTSNFSKDTSESFICKFNPKTYPRKVSTSEGSGFDRLTVPKETNIRNFGFQFKDRINEFQVNKAPLRSSIFKTEAPTRRLRSSLLEKRKTRISRLNMIQGLKNSRDMSPNDLKVCTMLTTSPRPSLKVRSSYSKSSLQKQYIANYKGGKAINPSERSHPPMIRDVQDPTENQNQETNETEPILQEAMECRSTRDEGESGSVGSSGCVSQCLSDCSSDQSLEVPCNDDSCVQKSFLTPINEESSECPSE